MYLMMTYMFSAQRVAVAFTVVSKLSVRLERALSDEDRVVRCLAALALSEIEGWEKGRARAVLKAMFDDPALSPWMRTPVRWVIHSQLVNGSEFSQPVHVLRSLVADLRH
jgi:hypothetical protein